MKKLFTQTLLITLMTTLLVTACGTTAPSNAGPTSEAATAAPSGIASALPGTASPIEAGTTPTAPASSVSFVKDVLPIFESRCINCHGGQKTEKGLDLKSYNTLMAGSEKGRVVSPGDPQNSNLAQVLLAGKMPKRGPKLTPSQVQMIVEWINNGAQNN